MKTELFPSLGWFVTVNGRGQGRGAHFAVVENWLMKLALMFRNNYRGAGAQRRRVSCRQAIRLCLAAGAMLLPTVCMAQSQPTHPPTDSATAKDMPAPTTADPTILNSARIEPGCLLRVDVSDETQLTGEYDVDAKGAIHFTLADEQGKHKEEWGVTVGQKTADEAAALVTESLKTYLRQPVVHVTLLKRPRLRVEMAGTGCKPGILELPLDARLSDVMVVCKQNADYAHLLLVRRKSRRKTTQTRLPLPKRFLIKAVNKPYKTEQRKRQQPSR